MDIGVVIPTRDRPWNLRRCVAALARASTPHLTEIVIIDDAGKHPVNVDSFAELADCEVVIVRNERRRGAAASRNRGAEFVTASAIGFLDDDSEVLPNWLEVAQSGLHSHFGAMTGRVERITDDLLTRARQARYERRYEGLKHGDRVRFLAGGNAVVRRDLFSEVGGFPSLETMSDNALTARIEAVGESCHFVPSLRIEHWHNHGWHIAIREAWRAGKSSENRLVPSDVFFRFQRAFRDHYADRPAKLVNICLECVFLTGNQWSRQFALWLLDSSKVPEGAKGLRS